MGCHVANEKYKGKAERCSVKIFLNENLGSIQCIIAQRTKRQTLSKEGILGKPKTTRETKTRAIKESKPLALTVAANVQYSPSPRRTDIKPYTKGLFT